MRITYGTIPPGCHYGRLTNVTPPEAKRCLGHIRMDQGSQIIRVVDGSSIRGLHLSGGASGASSWAALRGAVLKFVPGRTKPVEIDSKGAILPSGHTLMDQGSLDFTLGKLVGVDVRPEVVTEISAEPLFLLHASYCHLDQTFLPLGLYTKTTFVEQTQPFTGGFVAREGALWIKESYIDTFGKNSFDLLEKLQRMGVIDELPATINVELNEGGQITLR